jgi:hypothetical protein
MNIEEEFLKLLGEALDEIDEERALAELKPIEDETWIEDLAEKLTRGVWDNEAKHFPNISLN